MANLLRGVLRCVPSRRQWVGYWLIVGVASLFALAAAIGKAPPDALWRLPILLALYCSPILILIVVNNFFTLWFFGGFVAEDEGDE